MNELAKAGTQALSPERMKSKKGCGEIDKEDRIIPRLKIAQSTSPEVAEGIVKPGEMFNSVSKINYGSRIQIVPLLWWKSRIYWASREDGGDILCKALDGLAGSKYGTCMDCRYAEWNDKESPACTAIINIISFINHKPISISFMKTSYRSGKQLINLFNHKDCDIFNYEYELFTEQVKNERNELFSVMKFQDRNKAVSDEMYHKCSSLYEEFKTMKTRIHEDKPAEPETETEDQKTASGEKVPF